MCIPSCLCHLCLLDPEDHLPSVIVDSPFKAVSNAGDSGDKEILTMTYVVETETGAAV